jgi:hypothetical protein
MKKLELKNLKVKRMTKEEQSNVKAAGEPGVASSGFNCTWQTGTTACGNYPSQWPLSCSQG